MAQTLPEFGLRAGDLSIAMTSARPDALRRFVAEANEAQRISGLPDELNPAILDPDKVVRLVAALPSLPGPTLARLAGHELYLDEPGLQVRAAYPSRPESLDRSFGLEIQEVQGKTVMARLDLPPDLDLARSRARDMAGRYLALSEDVTRVEQGAMALRPGDSLRLAKERRLAAARAWRMNALAWAQAAPTDPEAKEAAAAADAAARSAALPPRGGTVPG